MSYSIFSFSLFMYYLKLVFPIPVWLIPLFRICWHPTPPTSALFLIQSHFGLEVVYIRLHVPERHKDFMISTPTAVCMCVCEWGGEIERDEPNAVGQEAGFFPMYVNFFFQPRSGKVSFCSMTRSNSLNSVVLRQSQSATKKKKNLTILV